MFPVTDPRHGLRKNSGRQKIGSTLFESWRTGAFRASWISEDGRIVVSRVGNGEQCTCTIDAVPVTSPKSPFRVKRFKNFRTAMAAGVKRLT